MRNINKMGITEYRIHHLWWSFVGIIWTDIIFGSHFDTTVLFILNYLFVSLEIVNYLVTKKKRRNYISIIAASVIPVEICTIFLFLKSRAIFLWVCLSIAALISAFFGFLLLTQPIRRQSERKAIILRRMKSVMINTRNITSFCLVFFIGFCVFYTPAPAKPIAETVVQSIENNIDAEQWTVKNNIDTVKLLKKDEWENLNYDQKLDVLATVVNIENRYLLGGAHPLYICSVELDEKLLGTYCESEYMITISADLLKKGTAEECLTTVLHECYHAYQYMQVKIYDLVPEEYKKMLMLHNASLYKDELMVKDEDFEKYISSNKEIQARKYAELGVPEYYELIDKYTEEES